MTLRKPVAVLLLVVVLCAAAPWQAASPASLAGFDGCCPADARGNDPCGTAAGHDTGAAAAVPDPAAPDGAEGDGRAPAPACGLCDCCATQRVTPRPTVEVTAASEVAGPVAPVIGHLPSAEPPRDVFHPPRLLAA